MKQRLGISRTILHEPKLIILDEPLSGLDPSGRKEVLHVLEHLRKEGNTILLSSHELKDMDTICDQLFVMRTGKIIAKGSPKKLISTLFQANEVLTFNLHAPTDIIKNIPEEMPEILKFEDNGDSFKITIKHNPKLERKILRWLLGKNVDFSYQKHLIDSIYMHLFTEDDKK
jgi:ABC-2 type transport system ATP-binding protein